MTHAPTNSGAAGSTCGLTRLSISGFRRLASVEGVELRPLTVLIGANGAGKSSFLDVIALLSASASGGLNKKLSSFGGIGSLLTRGVATELTIGLQMGVPGPAPLDYHLELETRGQGYHLAAETLTQQNDPDAPEPFKHIQSRYTDVRYYDTETKKLVKPNWDHDYLETSLSQVPKMYQQPESLRKRLSSLVHYAALNFSAGPNDPLRLPQPMRPASLPGPSGEELVSCLYYLRETDADRFEIVTDTLHAAFPGFERLEFPPVAAGTLTMGWRDRDFPREALYPSELSEGTLRFLWLVALLQSPGLTDITLIDEPEVSLHPDMLRLLADLLREASDRTQLIVATQSDRLVGFLKPEEVLVCDTHDGQTELTWADTLDLEKWLEDYSLDELWRMGRMGGRE